jgi:transposase
MSAVALPDLNALPADALRALILAQHEQLISREREIEHLQLLLAKLQRMQFGRKSEKLERQIEQLELRLEELESKHSEQEPNAPAPAPVTVASTPITKPTRRALPDHLPRQTRRHEPKETVCPECQGELRKLGEDVSEMLEYVPASFVVIRQVRTKLSCSQCDCIVQAAAPSRPIARGMAGPGLLAHVLVSKYCDHLPLYRQSEIYARQDVELERSTLADWVGGSAQLLEPLVEALRRYVTTASKLHADDTPVPVLAPGQGKTKTGRLWTYVRDDHPAGDTASPAVWFAYSPDRKGEHPERHLEKFLGTLQADAYAGFNQLYENGRIQQAACWAHVRRKFYDLEQAHASPVAREALVRIGALYGIRRTDSRPAAGAAPRSPPGAGRAPARLSAPVVRSDVVEALAQVGDDGGDSLCPFAMGRADALYIRMDTSRSTTTPPNARCVAWRSGARITCLRDRMRAANAQQPSTA